MAAMSLRAVNLNLLPVLRALLRERNLSRAAETLHLSQPAVSGALLRLRAILGDPLLVREGRGMALTLRGQELIEPVERICASLENLLDSEEFDPAQCERRFVIASADYAVITIAPMLLRAMAELAPGAIVHFVDTPSAELELRAGEVDLFIVPELLLTGGRHPALRHVPAIQDEFVTIVAANHRFAGKVDVSEAEIMAERHIVQYPALFTPSEPGGLIWPIGAMIGGRNIVAQVQQFGPLAELTIETGCAALIPRRIAERMRRSMPIAIIESGLPPMPVSLALAWHSSANADPALCWFRQLVIEQCALLDPLPGRAD